MDTCSVPPPRKLRRVQLPSVINPNLDGFLIFSEKAWSSLASDERTFVRNYNRAIRHSKQTPKPPSGTTIGSPKDNGTGNGDILNKREYKLRRCRRKQPQVRSPVTGLPPPQLAQDHNRRVLFNLDNLQPDDDRPDDNVQCPVTICTEQRSAIRNNEG